jgi:polyisoprenoid-binding protein YceI
LLPALLVALALPAGAADWKMSAAESRLDFAATFERAPAPGVFRKFDVRMRFDPARPAGGTLDVTIDIPSADMSSADVNKAIAGPDWFDFARFPKAEFHSTEIRPEGAGYVARGMLSLKGARQPVEVPFSWKAWADGATLDGEFTVKRSAFSIGTGEWKATDVIGPVVKVKFHVLMRNG